jgi:hypothetical protein
MAGSDGKQTGILGRLRDKRDTRRQRRADKVRIQGEAKREWERTGQVGRPPDTRGAGGAI